MSAHARNDKTSASRPQAVRDCGNATHAAWIAAHAAGLTRFGRATQTSRPMGVSKSKGAQNKRACRGHHSASDE